MPSKCPVASSLGTVKCPSVYWLTHAKFVSHAPMKARVSKHGIKPLQVSFKVLYLIWAKPVLVASYFAVSRGGFYENNAAFLGSGWAERCWASREASLSLGLIQKFQNGKMLFHNLGRGSNPNNIFPTSTTPGESSMNNVENGESMCIWCTVPCAVFLEAQAIESDTLAFKSNKKPVWQKAIICEFEPTKWDSETSEWASGLSHCRTAVVF